MEGGGFILLSIGPSIPVAAAAADPIELPAPPALLRLAV